MRKFSANIKTLLQQEDMGFAYLVELKKGATVIRETTAGIDITIPAIGVFTSNSGLLTVDAPRLSKVVDRELYKIAYIDPDFEKRAMFEDGLTGTSITIYVCPINNTTGVLGGVQPGDYMTDIEDLVIVYKGMVDTQGYAINTSENTVIATIECASPMASLGMVKPFYTSKDSMAQVNRADTAFDQVYQGSRKMTYPWGKA